MHRLSLIILLSFIQLVSNSQVKPFAVISKSFTIDSLGACQGISKQGNTFFLYGDREYGVIRRYRQVNDSLVKEQKEIRLTIGDSDVINHPTGIAFHKRLPVFIGNSIRLNKEGTLWKAVIYAVNWKKLQKTGVLDGCLLQTIVDDTCIQGTRPEYVLYQDKWYVATADYGGVKNEVRLYDPYKLRKAVKTSDPGVLVAKFSCSPWVQNLCWIPGRNWLMLIQNQVEGKKWRLTIVDLATSIAEGKEKVLYRFDLDRGDELEGFTLLDNGTEGVAVTSSRKDNVNRVTIKF